MSAPAAPQISAEDIKLDHGKVPSSSDVKLDIATVLSGTADRASRIDAVKELVDDVKLNGPHAFVQHKIADAILKGLADKKNAGVREASCDLLRILVEQGVGNAVEPFFYEKVMKTIVAETFADKEKNVREAAVEAVRSVVQVSTSWAVPIFLPILLEQIKTAGKWQVKTGAPPPLGTIALSGPGPRRRPPPRHLGPGAVRPPHARHHPRHGRRHLGHQVGRQEGRPRLAHRPLRPRHQQGYREVCSGPHVRCPARLVSL